MEKKMEATILWGYAGCVYTYIMGLCREYIGVMDHYTTSLHTFAAPSPVQIPKYIHWCNH